MEVYKKVRAYIDGSGCDKGAVARRAGISGAALDAMLSGRRTIYADDLRALCLALNVSPELFIDAGNPTEHTKGDEKNE